MVTAWAYALHLYRYRYLWNVRLLEGVTNTVWFFLWCRRYSIAPVTPLIVAIAAVYEALAFSFIWLTFTAACFVIITDAPSGRSFIMMLLQRWHVFQLPRLLIPTGELHKFLWWTKYTMFLIEWAHQGLLRGFLFSFVVRKEYRHC